jgi:hypothetical protein
MEEENEPINNIVSSIKGDTFVGTDPGFGIHPQVYANATCQMAILGHLIIFPTEEYCLRYIL